MLNSNLSSDLVYVKEMCLKMTLFGRKNVTSLLFDGYTPPVLTWLLEVMG